MDPRGQGEIATFLYVVDASVVAKWVLPGEPNQENAEKLKEDHVCGAVKLVAPSFLSVEVANSLWRAVRLSRLSEEDAVEALKALEDMNIEYKNSDWSQLAQVLSVACKLDVAIYDACYVFLAKKLKAPLITADSKLCQATGGFTKVLLIKEYL